MTDPASAPPVAARWLGQPIKWVGTRGEQYSGAEIGGFLRDAGFDDKVLALGHDVHDALTWAHHAANSVDLQANDLAAYWRSQTRKF